MKNPLFLMPLVAALFSLSLPAQSADYHVMVPAPGKVASYASIKLELNPASLPVGVLGEPYAGFDFNTALRITGDPELDMSEVSWSRYSGEMPDGLTLARDGSLHGIPSQTGNATFQALAKYKTKTALRTYTAAINDVTLILDAAPPQAHPLREYSYSLADHLVIKGDPGYSPAAVAWSLIEGTLPSGLNLSDDGTISGKPSSAGQYVITFQASYKGRSVSKPLQLDVVWIEINIQEESGARQWEDGRFADSCMSYMHPSGIYHYSGAIGDGVYRIARGENAPLEVYCDMTTDGGGWTLAAWSKGFAGRHNVTPDFMVRAVNLQDVHNKEAQNYAASLNVEDLSKSLQTSDVMLKASAYSPTPIIHNNREIWDYNMAACDGSIGHTSRTEGCLNHDANDNFDSVDQFNIALYGYGYNPTLGTPNAAIVPGHSPEICYLHHGWCDFEFYLR